MLDRFLGLFSRDIGIDLGTANTLVYRQGEGIVFDEPTVVAMNATTGAVEAMGEAAWRMVGGRSGNVSGARKTRSMRSGGRAVNRRRASRRRREL